MPPTFRRIFRVRHYECDAYGHLNNANYLHYMQESAFDASSAVGYDRPAYDALGTIWLIRETDIEYLSPLRYDDQVEITTYVLDFRRVRSRRAYDFRRVDTGDLVASAVTDWVYLYSDSLRPAPIPPAMVDAFLPDGPPEDAPFRERFPEPPPPPPGVFTMRRLVEWRDIDPMQHVNNATYLTYLEECGVRVADAYGWPMSRTMEEGFGIVARRHHIEYLLPAVQGDEVEIATWLSNVRSASVTRHYTITRPADQALLARARTTWVWVNLETMRPIRVPEVFIRDFADNISRS